MLLKLFIIFCVTSDHITVNANKTRVDKNREFDKKDAKFWSTVDLRKEEVPKGVNDIGYDYVIHDETGAVTENSTEIEKVKIFFREAKPKGPDSGQVPI